MIPTILILYDTIQQVATNATSSGTGLSNLGSIASIVGVFLAILFFLIPKKGILDILLPHIWRKKYIENNLPDSFFKHIPHDEPAKSKKDGNDSIQTNPSDEEIIDGNIYIQPYIIPQTNKEKPTPILLKDYFNKVFVKRSEYPNVYLLLGNSGTGKTAALAHYFYDYINNHTKKNLPYEIRLFSLGQEDVLNCINKVDVTLNANNKKNCILLLDALDENKKAQGPKENVSFFQQLEKVYKQFAFVIITCRPQFFTEGITLPNVTTIELAPFNNQQVQDFLDQTFSISYEAEKRSKAAKLIKKHYKIASRPIILTYIRDIVESDREINTSLDFYNVIVEKELHRNMKRAELDDSPEQIQRWWDMTSEVAGYMYKQGKTEISYEELLKVLINHHLAKPSDTINEDNFQRRSLLTKTGDTFHFSHKSFYEYFMAYRFFLYPDEIKQVYGMDFALQLFDDLYAAYKEKHPVFFVDLQNIPLNIIATSFGTLGVKYLINFDDDDQAKSKLQIAFELFESLNKQNNGKYLEDIATSLQNIAIIHLQNNQIEDAKIKSNKALIIYRQLAEMSCDSNIMSKTANTLELIADIYEQCGQYKKAIINRNEAEHIHGRIERFNLEYEDDLFFYRQQNKENPDLFQDDIAMTLINLANIHSDTNQVEVAEEEYIEALNIYRQLKLNNNTYSFQHEIATTLISLANLHSVTPQIIKAEMEFKEALSIYCQLSVDDQDAYLPKIAFTLYNMALFYLTKEEKNLPSAEAAAQKSLKKYRLLAELNHEEFDPYVNRVEELLEDIRQAKEEAE